MLSEYDNELPPEFPVSVSKLANKIRDLEDENGRLRHLVSQQDSQIDLFKKKIKAGLVIGIENKVTETSSNSVSAKVVELSKRLREKSAQLECEISKNSSLKHQIQLLSRNVDKSASAKRKEEKKLSKDCLAQRDDENDNNLEECLKNAELKINELRTANDTLKSELKFYLKILKSETGLNSNELKTLSQTNQDEKPLWVGRQDTINSLRAKLSNLKYFKNSSYVDSYSCLDSASRLSLSPSETRPELAKLSSNKQQQIDKLTEKLNQFEAENVKYGQELCGLKSRCNSLAQENKMLKFQTNQLIQKSKNDNDLIETVKVLLILFQYLKCFYFRIF